MGTERSSWKYQEFCRICFEYAPNLLELGAFLPVISIVAQTKVPCNDEISSKICNCCANCLIMANLFRLKVIESNGKYRELIKFGNIKKEHEEEVEETILDFEVRSPELPMQYEEQEQISENYMQVEFLHEDVTETSETIQFVKGPSNKVAKRIASSIPETEPVQKRMRGKANTTLSSSNSVSRREKSSQPVCFICTEPTVKKNDFSPFRETLGRILPVHNCNSDEYVCQKCTKKLEDSKLFFSRLDKVKKSIVKRDCCQFCSTEVLHSLKTSKKNALETFISLQNSGCAYIIKEDTMVCYTCIQLLSRIRMLKNTYVAKEKFFAKQHNRNQKETNSVRKRFRSSKASAGDLAEDSGSFIIDTSKIAQKSKRKSKLRIRSTPTYIKPNPNEPLPEDYQCHMSDFEEIESDTDIPDVPFRAPLNVPFKHKYLNCPQCNLKFVNSCEMDVHFEIMHETTDEVCNVCHKAFKDVKTVKDHKFACHTIDFSAFNFRKLCEICGLAKRKFENHYVIHFDVRAFKCQLCSCDYKTKASLEDHIRTVHMGEKRHKCSYCDKRFSYAADKARHEIGIHTKKFKYICQFCGKCFLKKNFLTAHQKSQHAEMLLDVSNQMEFKTESDL